MEESKGCGSALVAGAAGFLGRRVASELSESGYRVSGIGHGACPELQGQHFDSWMDAAISYDSLSAYGERPDVIIHCAGGSSVGRSIEDPFGDFQRSVDSTAAMLEYIRAKSPETAFIYLSSAAVYGAAASLPIAENATLNPVSPYGVHKQMAECLCQLYARQFGISVAIIRLFSVYGEGLRKQLLWDACNKIVRGERTFFGTGDEVRDWFHVSDAVSLIVGMIEHASAECPIVNGGSGNGVCVREVLESLSRGLGTSGRIEFTGETRAGDPVAYIADTKRARTYGLQPSVTFGDGLDRYVKWFRDERR